MDGRVIRIGEALVVGVVGGAIAWGAGWVVSGSSAGFGTICATSGLANGAVSGYAGIYRWTHSRGWLSFLLDSSWALLGTTLGLLIVHLPNAFWSDPRYRSDLCHRKDFHLYERGMSLDRGFAFTAGNVTSNAGTLDGFVRFTYVMRHERFHVVQNRIFGPLFQIAYLLWTLGGTVIGLVVWLTDRNEALSALIRTAAYYDNPFEYWAYRNDENWPPADMNTKLAWPPRVAREVDHIGPVAEGETRDGRNREVRRLAGRPASVHRLAMDGEPPRGPVDPGDGDLESARSVCHAFVSYSSGDRATAMQIVAALNDRGVDTWIDTEDIAVGAEWEMAIDTALAACGRLLILISPASMASKHVLDELAYAQDYLKKDVIPVMIEECVLPRRLFRIQYADLRNVPPSSERLDEVADALR